MKVENSAFTAIIQLVFHNSNIPVGCIHRLPSIPPCWPATYFVKARVGILAGRILNLSADNLTAAVGADAEINFNLFTPVLAKTVCYLTVMRQVNKNTTFSNSIKNNV